MILALALLGTAPAWVKEQPVGLFLTWQRDPTTTMTIDWHTLPEDHERQPVLQFKRIGTETWQTVDGESHPFPYTDTLKFSPVADEDYEGVEIFLDEISVFTGEPDA